MPDSDITDEDVAELVELSTQSAKAFIRGDMRSYFALIRQGDDFTLMPPFGGEPTRGANASPEYVEALERYFRGGEVGGLPDQDWSLRVTLVFRRDEAGWRQLHRHADALVHPISLEQLSLLARGEYPRAAG